MNWLLGLIDAFAGILGVSEIWVALVFGTLIGGVILGGLGHITMRYHVWRQAIDAPTAVQQAFTTKTPQQVRVAARDAKIQRGCFTLQLFLFLGLPLVALALKRAGLLDDVMDMLLSALRAVLMSL